MGNKIRVAIVGVGNCASALVQGVKYYLNERSDVIPGIGYGNIGGYYPGDITFTCAFDVDERKIGRPLKEAIFSKPNCARVFAPEILTDDSGQFDAMVHMGPVLDGVSDFMRE